MDEPDERRRRRPRAEVVRDDAGFRFVVVVDDVRSAPSTDCYPSEDAAWAAASRHGLVTPHDR